MIDFFRAAGLAALVAGAAQLSAAPSRLVLSLGVAEPAEVPGATPDVDAVPVEPPVEATPAPPPRAASLAALVRMHLASDAADDEQECLAEAVYFESKGEPLEGQLAVARVIMNRAGSGRFADTLCGVVRQHGQFSFIHGAAAPHVARDSANWRTAVAIAAIAHDDLWEAPATGALYFHARRVSPNWRMVRVASVGNHVFYR